MVQMEHLRQPLLCSKPTAFHTIVFGGLLIGVLDMFDALIFFLEFGLQKPKRDPVMTKLELENNKLREEIRNLQYSNSKANRLVQSLAIVTTLLAVVGFGFGIWQSVRREAVESQRQNELLEKQNRMKFYEQQLDIYMGVSDVAAQIVGEKDMAKRDVAFRSFLTLYYGKLVIADYDQKIKASADRFKTAYEKDPTNVEQTALDLSSNARDAIKTFWQLR